MVAFWLTPSLLGTLVATLERGDALPEPTLQVLSWAVHCPKITYIFLVRNGIGEWGQEVRFMSGWKLFEMRSGRRRNSFPIVSLPFLSVSCGRKPQVYLFILLKYLTSSNSASCCFSEVGALGILEFC